MLWRLDGCSMTASSAMRARAEAVVRQERIDMRLIVVLMLASIVLMAQDQPGEKFSVQKIDQERVARLANAEAKMEASLRAFHLAETALKAATDERDKVASEIKSSVYPFEGECAYPNYGGIGSKKYRRVEIRGEYLLISDGSSSCGTNSIITVAPGSTFLSTPTK